MSNDAQPSFANAWLAQWSRASSALARVHADELRGLTATDALAAAEALLSLVDPTRPSPERDSWSGLVEQQRSFMRARLRAK